MTTTLDITTPEGQLDASAKVLELAGCKVRRVPIKGWLEFQPPEGGMYRLVPNLFAERGVPDYSRESLDWLNVAALALPTIVYGIFEETVARLYNGKSMEEAT